MWFTTIVQRGRKSKGPLSYFMSEWNLGSVQRNLKFIEGYPNNNNDELIDLEIEALQETIEYLKLFRTSTKPEERELFIKNFGKNWKAKLDSN